MLRCFFLIVVSAATAAAQFHWTCNPKDGKFMRGFGSEKYYCWDGQIFSTTPGYTPPPKYVLDYWVEVQRKMEQTRADIARKGQEMAEKVHQAQLDTARMSQERLQKDQAFNDELNRKIAEQRGGQSSARPISKGAPVLVPEKPESAAIAPPVSRAKASEVQVGMDRVAVEGILGKPHGSMSIPEDDGLVEVLNYALDDKGTAKVRLEKGKVVSVKMLD
ncbi:MAG: hypothetical protein ABSB35_36405 [Bryobacteraceae bacterium]|jgi:hypothetical protein